MTLLASWVAIDSHKPSAVYIASDSRITWEKAAKYDNARKVYACRNSPDIFGYCGDVLFPVLVLGQLVELIDAGLLFKPNEEFRRKRTTIIQYLNEAIQTYPTDKKKKIFNTKVEILYCTREGEGMKSVFRCVLITWDNSTHSWHYSEYKLPETSGLIHVVGSGTRQYNNIVDKHKQNDPENGGTSRAMFQTFCDIISQQNEKSSFGGHPQLVGLYRKPQTNGRVFGIIHSQKRYWEGLMIDKKSLLLDNDLEWRNEKFERCDGITMHRLEDAQAQPYTSIKIEV